MEISGEVHPGGTRTLESKPTAEADDAKAKSVIAQCVTDKFIELIKTCATAASMLKKIEEVFERKSVFNQL